SRWKRRAAAPAASPAPTSCWWARCPRVESRERAGSRRTVMILALLVLLAGAAPEGRMFDLHQGTLSATVVHTLHEVKWVTRQLEGRALVQPDGSARVQVRAKVASFDSGNSNRDEHMREVTHETRYPYVTVKGTASGLTLPLAAPLSITLHAT